MTQRARLGKQVRNALDAQTQAQKNSRIAQKQDTATCLHTGSLRWQRDYFASLP